MQKEHIQFDISFHESDTGASLDIGTQHREFTDAGALPQQGDIVIFHDPEGERRFCVSYREFDFRHGGRCVVRVYLDLITNPEA